MTDQSLLLLENLTYLSGNVSSAANIELPDISSVASLKEYLDYFDENALRALESHDEEVTACATGREWAATIRALQNDPDIMSLTCTRYDTTNFAMCFTDPNGKAYVAFQGTANGEEWVDNVEGLNVSDTECQKKALDFIESLPYDDISVVGHSKGGNKAMYVTITSDKVSHCVSMDGQGFSQEFLDKYGSEIAANGGKITNYSLDTDYVHILLFPVPGSNQQYYANGGEEGLRNHSPLAYYQLYQEADGSWHFCIDDNGTPVIIPVSNENQGIAYLHDFTSFVINVMPNDKKQQVVGYLGNLIALIRVDGYHCEGSNGKIYSKENLTEYILSDQETLSLVLAYVLKYADTVGLSEEEIRSLLEAFGFGEFLKTLEEGIKEFSSEHPIQSFVLGNGMKLILALFVKQIKDGKKDPLLEKLLEWLGGWLAEKYNLPGLDLAAAWRTIEKEYHAIGKVSPKKSIENGKIAPTKIYDYTDESFETIIQTIHTVNNQSSGSVSGWSIYSSEEWFNKINVALCMKGINGYYDYISQINENCLSQIEKIYDLVRKIDSMQAESIRLCTDTLKNTTNKMNVIAMRLG